MSRISTCTDMITDDTNVPTKDDKYPWLDPDDKRRYMTDAEILRLKLNLEDSLLDDKGKEEFLTKTDDFHDIFNLRDEIGTCPFIEVHLKLNLTPDSKDIIPVNLYNTLHLITLIILIHIGQIICMFIRQKIMI